MNLVFVLLRYLSKGAHDNCLVMMESLENCCWAVINCYNQLAAWVHGWQSQITAHAISYPYTRNSSVGYSSPRKASPCGNLLRETFSSIASKEQCTTKCSFRSWSAGEGEKLWKNRGLFWGPTIAKQTMGMENRMMVPNLWGLKHRHTWVCFTHMTDISHIHTPSLSTHAHRTRSRFEQIDRSITRCLMRSKILVWAGNQKRSGRRAKLPLSFAQRIFSRSSSFRERCEQTLTYNLCYVHVTHAHDWW